MLNHRCVGSGLGRATRDLDCGAPTTVPAFEAMAAVSKLRSAGRDRRRGYRDDRETGQRHVQYAAPELHFALGEARLLMQVKAQHGRR